MADNNKKNDEENETLAYGLSFGLLGGTVLASLLFAITNSPLVWAFGPGFGLLIGLIISTFMEQNKKK